MVYGDLGCGPELCGVEWRSVFEGLTDHDCIMRLTIYFGIQADEGCTHVHTIKTLIYPKRSKSFNANCDCDFALCTEDVALALVHQFLQIT